MSYMVCDVCGRRKVDAAYFVVTLMHGSEGEPIADVAACSATCARRAISVREFPKARGYGAAA